MTENRYISKMIKRGRQVKFKLTEDGKWMRSMVFMNFPNADVYILEDPEKVNGYILVEGKFVKTHND